MAYDNETNKRCGNCVWYAITTVDADKGGSVGECRRYPPQITADGDGSYITRWPLVQGYRWCGEFTPEQEDETKAAP